jgi:hypothetical protein
MKKLIILLFVVFTTIVYSNEFTVNSTETIKYSDYCNGFKEGWHEGWCSKYISSAGCYSPAPPACPIPPIYRSSYNDGYNDGYRAGKRANS